LKFKVVLFILMIMSIGIFRTSKETNLLNDVAIVNLKVIVEADIGLLGSVAEMLLHLCNSVTSSI